jgi:putative phosphoesterase
LSRITLGLVADTHVPDRRRALHPQLMPLLERAKVQSILHAGDICVPRVLSQLEEIAPVVAVRGNRDWFGFSDLPMRRVVNVGGLRIGLTHGHLSWGHYAADKLRFLLRGPQSFDYFTNRVVSEIVDVDAVVFGHNHEPLVREIASKLVINPGSACCQVLPGKAPSFALLHIEGSKMDAEIVFLD